jgi:acetyl-CoA carboxylase carboxyltransferase component
VPWTSTRFGARPPNPAERRLVSAVFGTRRRLGAGSTPCARSATDAALKRFQANPYQEAELGFVDQAIRPRETRRRLGAWLDVLRTKRDRNPSKKHGNIPL